MSKTISGRYAIVGIGDTDFSTRPTGRSSISLMLEASKRAIEDSGLPKGEIDGVLSWSPIAEPTRYVSAMLAQYLGLGPLGYGADVLSALSVSLAHEAVGAIEAGLCRAVLCVIGNNTITRRKLFQEAGPAAIIEDPLEREFYIPYGIMRATPVYAMAAQRHMHLYGTTSRQLGAIAVTERRHACLNPNAAMRDPMTIEDHQSSRWIVEPLHLLDCCIDTDGGGAFVVTSLERALDLARPPIVIGGIAQCHTHRDYVDMAAGDFTSTGARIAGERALGMAGLSTRDVDVAQLYDSFTYLVLVQLEDLGFCAKGEGGPFVEGGNIALGGTIPVNTSGGQMSHAHVEGMPFIVEAVRQLRGVCGERQVRPAEVALVTNQSSSMGLFSVLVLTKGG